MGILSKLGQLFHHMSVKAESAIDKLITAEMKIETILHDTEVALDKQKENAKTLFSTHAQFKENLSKLEKDVTRYKTRCEVLKRQVENEKDEKTKESLSDDLRIAAAQYLENKNIYDDLVEQEKELTQNEVRVEKMLKNLRLNKSLAETKAAALKTKITMYKSIENINENGVIDINTTFSEVDEMVNKMKFDMDASRKVDAIVNGKEDTMTVSNPEIDDFIASL